MVDTKRSTAHPVVPVPGGVVFPGTVATLSLADPALRAAVEAARSAGVAVLLVPEIPARHATVGVLAAIEQVGELPGGQQAAIVRGQERARLGAAVVSERAGLWVEATPVPDPRPTPRVEALGRELREVLAELAQLRRSRRLPEILRTVGEPGALADAATAWAERPADEQLDVLEAVDLPTRLTVVLGWARDLLAETEVGEHVRTEVTENLQRQQREMLLRQQLAAIRKELGETDADPGAAYRARIAELPLPPRSARSWSRSSTGSTEPARSRPSRAGSAPGSTACSTFPGVWSPTTCWTWRRRERCSTPTTPASTR
jgi:ATP-dependent Lon protease